MQSLQVTAFALGSLIAFTAPLGAQAEAAESAAIPKAKPVAINLDHSSPEKMVQSLLGHMKSENPLALWAGVAPTDRAKLQEIVRSASAKIDPSVYDAVIGLVDKLGSLVEKNASYFAANDMVNPSGLKPEEMKQQLDGFISVVRHLKASTFGSHATLTTFDAEAFMSKHGSDLLKNAMAASKHAGPGMSLPNFENVKVGTPEINEGVATIEVTHDDETGTITLRDHQGKWYFDITEDLAEMAKEVADMPKMEARDAMRAKGLIAGVVTPMLKPFEDCESQEEFDDAVRGVAQGVMGMLMGGMGGPGGRR